MESFCLRCDWTSETDEPGCPRCGAPLYRMERSGPPPAPPDVPPARPEPADVARSPAGSEREGHREEVVPPSVGTAERGRWRVIVLALVLTGAIVFGLTRGGELDAQRSGQEQARAEPSGPTEPSAGGTPPPALSACSGDPTQADLAPPAQTVPAATADYLFQSSLKSSVGTAPDLEEVVRGSSLFIVDGTTGTTVLRFAGPPGLALAPTARVIPSSEYTIELLFRFDHLTGFRKILDFKDGVDDGGLYVLDGCLMFYPKEQQALTAIGTDAYVQVILTRDSTDRVVGYVNGVRQFAFADRGGLAEVNRKQTLRFFVDDRMTTWEHSSGTVSQIRLFDRSLTANEVAALACTEFLIADTTPTCFEIPQ